jgi:hypothetical protein
MVRFYSFIISRQIQQQPDESQLCTVEDFQRGDVTDLSVMEQREPNSSLVSIPVPPVEIPVQVEILEVDQEAEFTRMTGCRTLPGTFIV